MGPHSVQQRHRLHGHPVQESGQRCSFWTTPPQTRKLQRKTSRERAEGFACLPLRRSGGQSSQIYPAALLPALYAFFSKLYALSAGQQVPLKLTAIDQVLQKELPLDLERIVVSSLFRNLLPPVEEV